MPLRRTVRDAVTGSSTSDGWYEIASSVKVTFGSQRSRPYDRQTANMAASTSSAPSPPASSNSPIRSVRSSTRGTAGPESSLPRWIVSGAGRSATGMRSMVRIRSCQGTSLVRLTTGIPLGGVNAVGACFALYVLGVVNADPSGSAEGACGTSIPSGRANSDVVSASAPAVRWKASPSGIANSDVVDMSPSTAAPPGGENALLASSDFGLRSSASVTAWRSLYVTSASVPPRFSMRTYRRTGRTRMRAARRHQEGVSARPAP